MTKAYNLEAARQEQQINRMQNLAARGICAFCPEYIQNETDSPIEIETKHWVVKKNDYPYERTKLHLLLIPKLHVQTLADLPVTAQQELIPTIVKAAQLHHLDSYAVGIRSGDMRYNGGSVEHLHAHLIVGDPEHADAEPVRFKMSSRPKTDS